MNSGELKSIFLFSLAGLIFEKDYVSAKSVRRGKRRAFPASFNFIAA